MLLLLILATGCRKDEPTMAEMARDQFYLLMDDWYLWYKDMPQVRKEDYSTPEQLLEALRVLPQDRWSYITSREEFEQYYTAGEYIGYGFGNMIDLQGNLWITFVFKDSPLYPEGIRRGWRIAKINGEPVTTYERLFYLLGENEVGVQNTFEFVHPDGSTVTHTFAKKLIEMNTLLHADTLHINNRITGHMVLKGFIGPTEAELDSIFQFFQAVQVEDIILDLRYNGGGQLDVTLQLAGLIADPSLNNQVFLKYMFNDKHISDNADVRFEPEAYSIGLDRLVVITSAGTASASEAIINGLNAWIEVVTIGDVTYGKPVGMNAWFYADYAFVPVTFKLTNKDGYGEYFTGLPVDSYIPDNPARDFGDREETNLKEAIHYLQTGTFTGMAVKKSFAPRPVVEQKGLRAEIGAN